MSGVLAGSVWPFVIVVIPLLIGLVPLVPAWRGVALWLLAVAPLPAFGFALMGAPGASDLPDLLLGVVLGMAPGGAILIFGMVAAVWAVAGLHVALTFPPDQKSAILAGFWCLTLSGNLAVFLAQDIVTFYVAFAAVSLAAWFIVVHQRTDRALHAGRIYIILAVLGEAALLVGLVMGASAADSLRIEDVRAALPGAPSSMLVVGLLVAGFGLKAGLVPLHVWLPLAHPAAPVPGSAVLSGAIVKAGVIGMILFLPAGSDWASIVIWTGAFGAFAAALWGLTQADPKAILAYSTVSQMGVILALVAMGVQGAGYYAMHHGFAKGALFLLVGVMAAAPGKGARRAALVAAALAALSVAGLPLSGGALAKAAAKAEMGREAALVLTATGVSTTLLLVWFLKTVARGAVAHKPGPFRMLFASAAALVAAAWLVPWAFWGGQTGLALYYPLGAAPLYEAGWPLLVGSALAMILLRGWLPSFPAGDLLNLLPRPPRLPALPVPARLPALERLRTRLGEVIDVARDLEAVMRHWPRAGLMMVGVGAALLASLSFG